MDKTIKVRGLDYFLLCTGPKKIITTLKYLLPPLAGTGGLIKDTDNKRESAFYVKDFSLIEDGFKKQFETLEKAAKKHYLESNIQTLQRDWNNTVRTEVQRYIQGPAVKEPKVLPSELPTGYDFIIEGPDAMELTVLKDRNDNKTHYVWSSYYGKIQRVQGKLIDENHFKDQLAAFTKKFLSVAEGMMQTVKILFPQEAWPRFFEVLKRLEVSRIKIQ